MSASANIVSNSNVGKIVLSYHSHSNAPPFIINIPEVDDGKFMTIAQRIAVEVKDANGLVGPRIPNKARSDDVSRRLYANITKTFSTENASTLAENSKIRADEKEEPMSDFNRSELQAHLKANKAEIDVVSASMKKDMAEWREQMRSDMRDVKDAIKSQQNSLDKHFSAQEVKLGAALQIQEHKFEKSLGDAKLDIIKWALGVPAIAFTIYKIYGAITGHPTP